MDRLEQEGSFKNELENLICRYADEFDLNAHTAVGILYDAMLRIELKLLRVKLKDATED